MVTVNDLLDLTFREVLENYCTIYNAECGYYYGIAKIDDVDDLFNEYDIEEYSEAFGVESIISDEMVVDFNEEIISMDKMQRIMNNLGINKKIR